MIRVGPAGWSYRDWKGIVYPDPAPPSFDPLAYLAGFFDTIEINATFYRPATAAAAVAWLARVAERPHFRFTAKAWRRFSHDRDTPFTRADVASVRAAFDPLHDAGRLGAVLLQFPFSFQRNAAARRWLDQVTTVFRDYPLVIEVRHASWNSVAFFEALADRGIGFANLDQPLYPRSIEPSAVATASVGYVRLHGRNYDDWFRAGAGVEARYNYLYSADELRPWADRASRVAETTDDVYVVTNNHYLAQAVANAVMLDAMLDPACERQRRPVPPGVVVKYADVLRDYAVAGPLACVGALPSVFENDRASTVTSAPYVDRLPA